MKPTRKQIENATDEQLAEWSRIYVLKQKFVIKCKIEEEGPHKGKECGDWFDENGNKITYRWNPAQNIGQAFELEEKINKLTLGEYYASWLIVVISIEKKTSLILDFDIIHATPRQRTKAALLVVLELGE